VRLLFFLVFFFLSVNSYSFDRIVSLSPALTEIVVYDGGKGKLVGVTDYCSLDLKADRVGGIVNPNIEKIISLHPDLILATNMTPLRVRSLLEKVAPVKVFHLISLEEIEAAVEKIGDLLGRDGKVLRKNFERRLEETTKGLGCLKGKRVFVVISVRPLYVAGSRSYIGEALERAGATVLPSVTFGAVSEEFLLKRAELVVLASYDENGFVVGSKPVIVISPEKLLHPSPYFLNGLKILGRKACALK